jgi:hypothetical protein
MMLDLLAQILDDAVEYDLLSANPARGKRRRLKVPKPARTFLEPDMVVDLLDVAGEWERSLPPHQRYGRRAFLATLCLAGPRISESRRRRSRASTLTPVGFSSGSRRPRASTGTSSSAHSFSTSSECTSSPCLPRYATGRAQRSLSFLRARAAR